MTDDELLAGLAALLRRHDPMPDEVRAAAEALFALAFPPPRWTFLEPVAELAAARSGSRTFHFADKEISVRLGLRGARLTGLVVPVLPVEVCWPAGSLLVAPDDAGFFVADGLPRAPLRLVVGGTRATRWFWP
ncbi:MAG: hypothetical protein ACJ72N_03200 [Labedaea sp.]